jgi:hypothetical protein
MKYLDKEMLRKKETEIQKGYTPISWDQTFNDFLKGLENLDV